MSNEKLRECPFCGSDKLDYESYGDSFTVVCLDCGAEGGIGDLVKACELWNTRYTPNHETVDEWEKRTGESYPDDAPVWYYEDYETDGITLYSWELATWDDVQDGYTGCIVANHNGKPEIEE